MPNYLSELLVASLACAIVGLLSDSLGGGLDKAVSLVCSLVLFFYLISPIVGMLKNAENGGIEQLIPDLKSNEVISQDKSDDLLINKSEDILVEREKSLINKKYKLDSNDYSLNITLSVKNEKAEPEIIVLTVRSVKALAYGKEIISYLEERYMCECLLIEDL